MRRDGASFKFDVVEGQRTGEFSELRIDEEAADVVLREERIDDLPCDGLVAVREVDEVRPAIDGHHDPRIFAITAD